MASNGSSHAVNHSFDSLAVKVTMQSPTDDEIQMKRPHPDKHRVLKTVATLLAFFGLGLSSSSLGPSIVSLEVLYGTDTKTISIAFSGGSLGFLGGTLTLGAIYSVIRKELLFACAMVGVAAGTVMYPLSGQVFVFIGVVTVKGFCSAITDAGSNAYILHLWEGHRAKEPLLQAIHAVWALGATLGPFIIKPFLSDQLHTDSTWWNNTTNNTDYLNQTSPLSEEDLREEVKSLRFPFIIISTQIITSAVLFFIVFFMNKPSCWDPDKKSKRKQQTDLNTAVKRKRKLFGIKMLALLFIFYVFYLWVEGISGKLLPTFLVKGMGMPNSSGALLSGVYWAANGIFRVVGIPLAAVMSAQMMLVIELIVMSAGVALLLFVSFHPSIVWIAAAVTGTGTATIFASCLLWASQYIEVTGAASSVFLAAAAVGSMTGPIFTAYLFDTRGHMSLVYILLAASAAQVSIFIGVFFYARAHGKRPEREEETFVEANEETERLDDKENDMSNK